MALVQNKISENTNPNRSLTTKSKVSTLKKPQETLSLNVILANLWQKCTMTKLFPGNSLQLKYFLCFSLFWSLPTQEGNICSPGSHKVYMSAGGVFSDISLYIEACAPEHKTTKAIRVKSKVVSRMAEQ